MYDDQYHNRYRWPVWHMGVGLANPTLAQGFPLALWNRAIATVLRHLLHSNSYLSFFSALNINMETKPTTTDAASRVFCAKHTHTVFVLFNKYKISRENCEKHEVATIKCDDGELKVHKDCVAKFAPKFAELFDTSFQLSNVKVEELKCALYFGLTGKCRMPDKKKLNVMLFCDRYLFDNIEAVVDNLLTANNFAPLLQYAFENDRKKLQKILTKVWTKHPEYMQMNNYRDLDESIRVAYVKLGHEGFKNIFSTMVFAAEACLVLFAVGVVVSYFLQHTTV